MYKFYIALFVVTQAVLFYSCHHKTDCTAFKTGKYYYYSKKSRAKILIARSDSLQTEIDTKTWGIALLRINWKSDCEYEISRQLPPRPATDTSDFVYAPVVTGITIVQCNKDYYVCEVGKAAPPVFPQVIDTIWVDK